MFNSSFLAVLVFLCTCFHLGIALADNGMTWSVAPSYETPASNDKDIAFKIVDPSGTEREMYSESYAVLIIEGDYKTGGWTSVPESAAKSERLLRNKLEELRFHVLVWRNITGTQLRAVVHETVANIGYREGARL